MSFTSLLNTTAAVYAPTRTQNDFGATEEAYTASIATLKCRLRALKASERTISGAEGVEVTHRLYCEAQSTDISEGDEVRISTTVFRVQAVNNVDRMDHHWELDLVEHRPDRHGR